MVVCRYFLQGNCRFGANCRNEHPSGQGGGGGGGGGGGFGNQNRFGALPGAGTGGNQAGTIAGNKQWSLNTADIRLDLTKGQGRPSWILSTYGAGRNTPASLFEGNEYSPEELRVRFYEMASNGQEAQADQEAMQLWSKAEGDMSNVASHIDDITKFMEEAEKKQPNRYDFLKADGTKTRDELMKAVEGSNINSSGFGTTSPFGQSTNTTNSPFSKPAAATFGQPSGPSAFGGSSFGKPAQPSTFGQSAFGQPSTVGAFGQPAPASAFGKPSFGSSGFGQSGFGQTPQPTTASTFGQPSQTTSSPAFGQPSSQSPFGAKAFGQTAQPSAFGTSSANSGFGASPAFGQAAQSAQPAQPSATFGQPTQNSSPFGQPPQSGTGFGQTAFGQPSQPSQPSAFGQPAFGQPAQTGSGSPFGQTVNNQPGFGNSAGSGGFGQAPQQNASPFGRPAAPSTAEVSMESDAPSQTNALQAPFGTQPPAATTAAVTAQPNAPMSAVPNTNTSQTPHDLTSKPSKPLHYTQTLPLVPPQLDVKQKLTSYRGQRVQYLGGEDSKLPYYNRPDRRGLEKIWFLNAGSTQEVVALNREEKISDLQAENDKYTDEVKQQFASLMDEGRFKDGKIPLVPPIRDWCVYDF